MSLAKEFKEFAMRGNVVDMAVGIIIGAAFGKIVASLVKDVVMPVVGMLAGGIDFTDMKYDLVAAKEGVEAITINYGMFIQTTFDFVIVAFAIFMMIKGMNSLKRKEEEAPAEPAAPPREEILLEEIRDLLAKK